MKFSLLIRTLGVALTALMISQSAFAQNLFAPVAQVNGAVVTEFELQQRQRFLQLLNAPGSDRETSLQALIDDRLRLAEANRLGVSLPSEGLAAGLTEFAGRANLSLEEFSIALGQAGVSEETLRDFVSTSLIWRDLVRARFGGLVNITDNDLDRERARATGDAASGIRVLLSEIIIPAPPQNAARVAALADQISQTRSEAEFSSFARRFSATASRGQGGRMPWTPLSQLPPSLHPIILDLSEGEVTAPLSIPNAVALFQLRGIEETGRPATTYSEIEYAAYYISGGRSEAALATAASIRARVDRCDDLYGIAQGQPEEVLERGAKAPGDIPRDIGIELAKLDPGEVSTALTRANGNTLVFLMLCKRTSAERAEADIGQLAEIIRQRELQGHADQLIEQLRADARIILK